MNETKIVSTDKKYIWHPFTQMKAWLEEDQIAIVAGEGVYLIDEEGRRYYDGVSSLWVNIHGHRRREIDEAIKEQLDKIAHSTLLGLVSPPSAQLAKELVELAPANLTKVFFSDDGSTAIEAALKMTFQYWQHKKKPTKQRFISLSAAYHGDTLGTVSVGGIKLFHRVFQPLLFQPIILPSPGEYSTLPDKEKIFADSLFELEEILKTENETIAGLIIEPLVQAAAGMLMMPPGYLAKVRKLTQKYEVLLIADEVAVGFGRTGTMFACEQEEVEPDFLILSKGITGGYMPLAATLTTQEIFDAFLGTYDEAKTFYHGHSYTGNALACAAALANLEIFRKDEVIAGLAAKIKAGEKVMAQIQKATHVREARQCGLIFGIELSQDKQKNIPYRTAAAMGAKVGKYARSLGLMIRPIGDVLILMPPLASTSEQITEMLMILQEAIIHVTEKNGAAEIDLQPTDL